MTDRRYHAPSVLALLIAAAFVSLCATGYALAVASFLTGGA